MSGKVVAHVASAAGNKIGTASWAVILTSGPHEKAMSGEIGHATGNAAAVCAVLMAVESLRRPVEVEIRTASAYVMKSVPSLGRWSRQEWVRQDPADGSVTPIANADLWRSLIAAVRAGGHRVRYVHAVGDARTAKDLEAEAAARERLLGARARMRADAGPEADGREPELPGLGI